MFLVVRLAGGVAALVLGMCCPSAGVVGYPGGVVYRGVVSYPALSVIPLAESVCRWFSAIYLPLVLGDPVAVEAVRYTDRQVHHSYGVVRKSISAEYAQIRAVGVAVMS